MSGATDRESILVQLRRERGLDEAGHSLLPLKVLNRLVIQSGIRLGLPRLGLGALILALITLAVVYLAIGVLFPSQPLPVCSRESCCRSSH